jgi:hypothetical protein
VNVAPVSIVKVVATPLTEPGKENRPVSSRNIVTELDDVSLIEARLAS